jgi:transcriptional regulator with XRE-family HTH domain
MKPRLLVRFGRRVREERNAKRLSQEAFADRCGLHRTYVGSIERCERNVSLLNVATIARTLEMTVAELTKGIEL